MVVSLTISAILAGIGTQQSGYYTPFLLAGASIAAIGTGLLTILKINTNQAQWIGYQIVYGFGLGACFQAPNMAAQTVLPLDEVSIGISLMLFAQTLFGAIFVSVGQNVLDQQLATRIGSISGIELAPEQIEVGGILGLFKIIPLEYHPAVLQAYDASLHVVFVVAVIMTCLTVLGSIGMEWRSVKKSDGPKDDIEVPKAPVAKETP